jgi:hypothetical protein
MDTSVVGICVVFITRLNVSLIRFHFLAFLGASGVYQIGEV